MGGGSQTARVWGFKMKFPKNKTFTFDITYGDHDDIEVSAVRGAWSTSQHIYSGCVGFIVLRVILDCICTVFYLLTLAGPNKLEELGVVLVELS